MPEYLNPERHFWVWSEFIVTTFPTNYQPLYNVNKSLKEKKRFQLFGKEKTFWASLNDNANAETVLAQVV